MALCKECGSHLSQEARFCKECGTPIREIKQSTNQEDNVTPNVSLNSINQTVNPVPMSKTKKRMLAIAGIAAVILFGGYKIGEALTSKDRLIERFETALIEKDEEAVAQLLSSNDPKLKINKTMVKSFMKYLEGNPEEVNGIIQTLKAQSRFMEETKNNNNFAVLTEEYVNDGLVNLEKDGKILFYDKYELNIEPVYLTIGTNYKGTKLYVNGKEIGQSNKSNYEKTFGPYLPGIYKLEAKLKTDYVELTRTEEIPLVDVGMKEYVSLDLEAEDVTVDLGLEEGNNTEAKLLINGKDVGVNLLEEHTFGPVLTDGSMKLSVEATLPWGKIKTKEVAIDSDYVEVNLGSDENFQNSIMDLIVKHTREVMAAYTSGDPNKLTTATGDYKQIVQENIDRIKEYGEFYKGKYLGTAFDLDSFNVYFEDGKWKVDVNTRAKYFEDTFFEGEAPELEENEYDNTVTLVYSDSAKSWLVDYIGGTYDFDSENIKEIKEENPQEYVTSWKTTTSEE
jgi:uncharacterized membrane protein YvbJ